MKINGQSQEKSGFPVFGSFLNQRYSAHIWKQLYLVLRHQLHIISENEKIPSMGTRDAPLRVIKGVPPQSVCGPD